MDRNFLEKVIGLLAHATPSIFFSKILRSEVFVYNSYFFQNSCSTEIFLHLILIQRLLFLSRLPTSQDGVENRDKVY